MQRATVLPRRDLGIGPPGLRKREFARDGDDAPQPGIELLDAARGRCSSAAPRSAPSVRSSAKAGTPSQKRCRRRRKAAAAPHSGCARTDRAPARHSRPRLPDSTASPAPAEDPARSCAAQSAARAAVPSTAASLRRPSPAGRRSSSPARVFRLPRTWRVSPRAPRPGRCRRSAARRRWPARSRSCAAARSRMRPRRQARPAAR